MYQGWPAHFGTTRRGPEVRGSRGPRSGDGPRRGGPYPSRRPPVLVLVPPHSPTHHRCHHPLPLTVMAVAWTATSATKRKGGQKQETRQVPTSLVAKISLLQPKTLV
jgi:hypothetical protein